MDLISILATVILVTTIGTTLVGIGAYAAFKLRDKRKPKMKKKDDTLKDTGPQDPIFLKRFVPDPSAPSSSESSKAD